MDGAADRAFVLREQLTMELYQIFGTINHFMLSPVMLMTLAALARFQRTLAVMMERLDNHTHDTNAHFTGGGRKR